jgi:hypothetical protein
MEKIMNYFRYLLLLGVSVASLSATVYEDGISGIDSWKIYDNKPAVAKISNVYDEARKSDLDEKANVIRLEGEGRKNAYELGARKGERSWNNSTEKVLHWSMRVGAKYKIYVYVLTKKGYRYLYYSHSSKDKGFRAGKRTSYIHHGLGKVSMDNFFHDYARDLEKDLKEYEPDNSIVSVNGFRFQGDAYVDDVILDNNSILDHYSKERFYTKDKKYFFAYNSRFYFFASAHEWSVVESKTNKLMDYNIWNHSDRSTPKFTKVKNIDIFVISEGNNATYYTINRRGELVKLNIVAPEENLENGHVDNVSREQGYISDTKFSVSYSITAKNEVHKYIYDVSRLPQVKLLSVDVVKN